MRGEIDNLRREIARLRQDEQLARLKPEKDEQVAL